MHLVFEVVSFNLRNITDCVYKGWVGEAGLVGGGGG